MGILRTAATVAVASSIHGRVQRRQAQRWAQQDQATAQAAGPPPPGPSSHPPPSSPSGVGGADSRLDQLAKLGELKSAGVLSEAEFTAEKARILGG